MQTGNKYVASCIWGHKEDKKVFESMAVDFMIVDVLWASTYRFFPLKFADFSRKYEELFLYNNKLIYLEKFFAAGFLQAVKKMVSSTSDNLLKKIAKEHYYQMKDREPVHKMVREKLFGPKIDKRTMYWPNMGLITHHDPKEKQTVLKEWNLKLGEYGNKFLNSLKLDYYNQGLKRIQYQIDGKVLDYND
jgi:hypothetical protein